MVRQYIGARYVPKFYENSDNTSEWRSGVSYEPLTVVTYNGNSYTSKKTVPSNVGNPSDNAEYWASTGIYNQQVEAYREEVLEFKEEIENEIAALTTRKVLFISDSYCDSGRGGYERGIYTAFCNSAGLTNGENAFIYAKGGAGFIANGQGKTFGDLLNDAYLNLDIDPSEITDIFIVGGINDREQSYSSLLTARNAALAYAHTHFENAKIHISVSSGSRSPSYMKQVFTTVRRAYYDSLPHYCDYLENSLLPLIAWNNFTDSVHPSGNGTKAIGKQLADFFLTGNVRCGWGDIQHNVNAYILNDTESDLTSSFYTIRSYDSCGYTVGINTVSSGNYTFKEPVNFTYGGGVLVCLGKFAASSDSAFPVPNAESTSDTMPTYRIPCIASMYVNDGTDLWMPVIGELLGVYDATNETATWYFKSWSANRSASATLMRVAPFSHRIEY